ncbi:beta-1,6-N-acetylglucosaminyltransferase [Bacteroides sp. An51A]|uniref:beta-1,6-N-acetylglucosaminyltransferase n=1 Tax=Bacteroides sp. An51A TaxID=1965640 RepID=UPI000B37ADB8|nr:beta-1,6-N-acetylglucosaminyltransferase [Bacteroides sp. An51A]OUN79587.1 hypothetical protein B5G04_12265 [Bacteroides sp. An51A]
MKLTYIITAHNYPQMLERLIERLKGDEISFIVHIDAKSKKDFSFDRLYKIGVNMLIINNVDWGGYSQVDAVLKCCKKALEINGNDGYCILLSGTDYPVKSSSYIQNYLINNFYDYITGYPLPHMMNWLEGGRRKISCYALRIAPQKIATIEPHVYNWNNLRQFMKVLRYNPSKFSYALKILFTYSLRVHPSYIKPYGGEFWWGLRMNTIKDILAFLEIHRDFEIWHHDTANPDEMFMNSLVYNLSKPNEIRNSCLRYIHWENGRGNSPGFIKDRKLIDGLIAHPDYLFARKINDCSVCDYIDSKIVTY